MGTVAGRLDQALRALNIPIEGVSASSDSDRTTWRIDYAASATVQQRADGETLRLAFDPFAQSAVDAEVSAQATVTSRQKDVLAICALVVRARGIAAWNAMTLQQKIDATNLEAAVWVGIRVFIEKNL